MFLVLSLAERRLQIGINPCAKVKADCQNGKSIFESIHIINSNFYFVMSQLFLALLRIFFLEVRTLFLIKWPQKESENEIIFDLNKPRTNYE